MELDYCSYCDGYGCLNIKLNGEKLTSDDLRIYLDGKYKRIQCPKCLGKKKVDWIEQIICVKIGRSSDEKTRCNASISR